MKHISFKLLLAAFILLFFLFADPVDAGDWPMYRYDAGRTGVSPDALPSTLYLQWVFELPSLEQAWPDETAQIKLGFDSAYVPVVSGKKLLISSTETGSVRAFDTETGTELWEYFTSAPVRVAPAVDSGRVFVLSDDGFLYCLNVSDGSLIWKFNGAPSDRKVLGNKNLISSWPGRGGLVISSDGNVYFACGVFPFMGVYVYSLNASTGDVNWINDGTGAEYMTQPHDGAVSFSGLAPQGYLAVNGNTLLIPNTRAVAGALNRTTGELLYFNHSAFKYQGGTFVATAGTLFANARELLNLSDGSVFTDGSAGVSSVNTIENGALLESGVLYTGTITARNTADLSVKWTYSGNGHVPMCKAGSVLYAGKTDSIIAVEDLGASASQVWQKPIAGIPAHMAAADNKLFVTTEEGYIYCFGETDNGVSLPTGGSVIIAVGEDWQYFKGTSFPGADWNTAAFDDSAWLTGPTGIGYGDGDDATVLSDMQNSYMTVYMRKEFTVADLSSISSLKLQVDYDDGFVAFINGTEAARIGVPAGQDENTAAVSHNAGTPETVDISDVIPFLVAGTNVLAIELHNTTLSSSDASMIPRLSSTGISWPSEDSWTTEADSIVSVSGIDQGYVICLGAGTGRLMEELVRQYGFNVIGIDPDASTVETLRNRWEDMGLSSKEISIFHASITSAALPPYLADLIVSEDQSLSGLSDGDPFVGAAFYSLRPYGGKVVFTGDHQTVFQSGVTNNSLVNAAVSFTGGYTILERQGALPDTADWDHMYADAANTLVSSDKLVKAPLGVLWFGGISNQPILPRHGHGPPELVSNGRLFIEGVDLLRAVDVYTGRVLWEKSLPGIGTNYNYTSHEAGAMAIGSNFVCAPDAVYVCRGTDCLKLDPATGTTDDTFTLPDSRYFAQLKVSGDKLIVAADPFSFTAPVDVGMRTNWHESSSRDIYVLNRTTGAVVWSVTADLSFMHNSIIVGNGTLYCIDRLPPGETSALSRRGLAPVDTGAVFSIKSFNVDDGTPGWNTSTDVFGTWLGYSSFENILIQSGRYSRDMVGSGGTPTADVTGRIIAYDCASSHTVLHDTSSGIGDGPYLLYGSMIIMQGETSGSAVDMRTGAAVTRINPLTGLSENWSFTRKYGCNTAIGCENLLTFRSGAAGYFDMAGGGTGNLGGFKSGCTSNLVPANGVLNAPDYTRTCTCAYQLQTSLALIYSPDIEMWTYNNFGDPGSTPIKNIGINFGASGDRIDANNVLWINYPPDSASSPSVTVNTTGTTDIFRDNSAEHAEDTMSWVSASGLTGMTSVTVTLNNPAPADYFVRLYFCEPEGKAAGERVFDVSVPGTGVLADFDVAAEAGSDGGRIVKTFSSISAGNTLTIDLTPSAGVSVLCGLEILEDTGGPVPNQAPVADAGTDIEFSIPGSVSLDSTVTDDGQPVSPGAVTVSWSKVSGPGTVTFGDASAEDTSALFSDPGVYVLRIEAFDGEFTVFDEVKAVISGSPPPPLSVSIDTPGVDPFVITTGSQSVSFGASASGGTGPYTYDWDFSYSGVFSADVTDSASGSTVLAAGDHSLAVQVSDGAADTSLDTVRIVIYDDNGTVDDYTDDSDFDGDGLSDAWEYFYFNDFDETATGDPDSDFRNNLNELNDRTDPTVSDVLKTQEKATGCSYNTSGRSLYILLLLLSAVFIALKSRRQE